MNKKNVIFTAHCGWGLYNFRYSLLEELNNKVKNLYLVSPYDDYVDKLKKSGFQWIRWNMNRRSINPLKELKSVLDLYNIYKKINPNIVHHDTTKPSLYGSIAAKMINLSSPSGNNIEVINSFLGIGYIWSSHAEAKIIRALVKPLMRLALRGSMSRTTFSNSADRRTFIENGLVTPERSQVLSSEFVNTSEFFPRGYGSSTESEFAGSQVRIVMASRLLWDKGVQEFVDAASVLRQKHGDQVEFVLAGEPDKKGRGWIPEQQLKKWDSEGVINWIGHCDAMPSLLRSADIAVLPSQYNEGLPRFLVEAAATGLPIVASDLAGCRRVVVNQANGFLVEPGSVEDLISRLSTLINSPERRAEMGEKSRLKAQKEYSDSVMIKKWMNMYK